jgi:molybdopterin molybdotransferase
MSEFFNVLAPDEARRLLFDNIEIRVTSERMRTEDALGRVTAESIKSPHALPSFRRSTMDGYAVRAKDTFGASDGLPGILEVVDEVEMGASADLDLPEHAAVIVHTGGMIPDAADAVVQVEHTQKVDKLDETDFPFEIEVYRAVAVGQNVLQIGEDVSKDSEVLARGHHLRPQDLGGLLALGITEVAVARKPSAAIISTGDEVVHPSASPEPGQIRDINSYTIASQTKLAGGIPVVFGIVPDYYTSLKSVAESALAENDMVVVSAGSSVSFRDMTMKVIDELGSPGVLIHGVATRPGKPTIIGAVNGKPLLGLPGNPVSAMVQFAMFGVPLIYRLQGLDRPPRAGSMWAKLNLNIASESGREDYVPARIEESDQGLVATPVFGKSNLIYTLVNADGLIKVPLNKAGLEAGEWVEVQFF